MKKIDIEVFSGAVNNSVIRMPERRYLGSVIQGDTLFLLHGEAMDILEELKHNLELSAVCMIMTNRYSGRIDLV